LYQLRALIVYRTPPTRGAIAIVSFVPLPDVVMVFKADVASPGRLTPTAVVPYLLNKSNPNHLRKVKQEWLTRVFQLRVREERKGDDSVYWVRSRPFGSNEIKLVWKGGKFVPLFPFDISVADGKQVRRYCKLEDMVIDGKKGKNEQMNVTVTATYRAARDSPKMHVSTVYKASQDFINSVKEVMSIK
jgi:hypothetical protein